MGLRHGLRSLKLVSVDMNEALAQDPVGVHYGVLDNGVSYYVRCNSKPGMLAVLALAVKVRVFAGDLEKERGAMLEEYRGGRNAMSRMHDTHWVLMFEGSKFAECLPIRLEKVIRNVTPETVK